MTLSDKDTAPTAPQAKDTPQAKPQTLVKETLSERIVEALNSGQMEWNHRPKNPPATTK